MAFSEKNSFEEFSLLLSKTEIQFICFFLFFFFCLSACECVLNPKWKKHCWRQFCYPVEPNFHIQHSNGHRREPRPNQNAPYHPPKKTFNQKAKHPWAHWEQNVWVKTWGFLMLGSGTPRPKSWFSHLLIFTILFGLPPGSLISILFKQRVLKLWGFGPGPPPPNLKPKCWILVRLSSLQSNMGPDSPFRV